MLMHRMWLTTMGSMVFAAIWVVPALAQDAAEFAGATTIHAVGSQHLRAMLPRATELTAFQLDTTSEAAAFLLVGPSVAFAYQVPGEAVSLSGFGSLDEGAYDVYVYVEGTAAATVSLAFPELEGATQLSGSGRLRSQFEALRPEGLLALSPQRDAQRFSGTQSFAGDAFTGFLVVERSRLVEVQANEFRWSNPGGVTSCWPTTRASVSGGDMTTWTKVLSLGVQEAPVTLDYFVTTAAVGWQVHVWGLWLEPAPGHAPPAVLEPRPNVLWASGVLDYDLGCVQQRLPPPVSAG